MNGAAQTLIEAIGWTLIHAIWQGLLAAAAVALLCAWLPRAKPNLRYAIACAGLLAIAVGGLVTFALEIGPHAARTRDVAARVENTARAGSTEAAAQPRSATPAASAKPTSAPSREAFSAKTADWRSAIGQGRGQLLAALGPLLPAIVVLWAIGVIVSTARLVLQWLTIRRVSSSRRPIEDPTLVARLGELAGRLGVNAPVGLFGCASMSVPFVLGWLKPAILLPAGVLTGLSAAELDAILAHELAHIRRHDYLVNLVQTLVETIYFYHPAVWWISRLVRHERECCCDELAAAACGDRVVYGRALLALEKWRDAPARLRLAADGGSLAERVRRLAGAHAPRPYRAGVVLLAVIALFGIAAVLFSIEGRSEPEKKTPKFVVAAAESKPVTLTQQFVGQIRAHRHINVRALERGYLEAIQVTEGQQVKRGDSLFKVIPILYQKKADAEAAGAALAQLELNSAKKNFDDKVVGPDQVALFEAKMARARAKADLAKAELAFATVKAPFDGIIDRLLYQEGSLVQEGETLTTLSDNSTLWVYFNVPEALYLDFMQNQRKDELKIELLLANGQKFDQPGKLGAVEADFNNETGSIPFRADFPNPDRILRHRQTGTVLVSRVVNDALVVPQRAVVEVNGTHYVYVLDKDGAPRQRKIVIQHELEDLVVVKEGVAVDDKIVVDDVRRVHDERQQR